MGKQYISFIFQDEFNHRDRSSNESIFRRPPWECNRLDDNLKKSMVIIGDAKLFAGGLGSTVDGSHGKGLDDCALHDTIPFSPPGLDCRVTRGQ
jgi:hypothetical protein